MFCCTECFYNEYIINYIKGFEEVGNCDYCKNSNVFVIKIEWFGEYLRETLLKGYVNATNGDIPYHVLSRFVESVRIVDLLRDEECVFSVYIANGNSCEGLIEKAFETSGPSARDIIEGDFDEWHNGDAEVILVYQFYGSSISEFSITWEAFKEKVKHVNRFFDTERANLRKEMLGVKFIFDKMKYMIPESRTV